jgi:hypothetical protein
MEEDSLQTLLLKCIAAYHGPVAILFADSFAANEMPAPSSRDSTQASVYIASSARSLGEDKIDHDTSKVDRSDRGRLIYNNSCADVFYVGVSLETISLAESLARPD